MRETDLAYNRSGMLALPLARSPVSFFDSLDDLRMAKSLGYQPEPKSIPRAQKQGLASPYLREKAHPKRAHPKEVDRIIRGRRVSVTDLARFADEPWEGRWITANLSI
jgi:hypothetical protein